MVTTCSVVGCKSEWNPFTDVTFHRVTKNKKILPLWRRVVKIKASSPHAKICSLHFRAEDFVDGKDQRRLRRDAVPTFSIIDKANNTDEDLDEDEEDNKNLSTLKMILASDGNNGNEKQSGGKRELDNNEVYNKNKTQDFEMVMSCCNPIHSTHLENTSNPKLLKNTGTQVERKTKRELSLQSRVKLLDLRLRRRDAKISYMNTVLNMIKKHVKGTDMEYKLCCELQNISTLPQLTNSNIKKSVSIKQNRSGSPVSDCVSDEAESSGDEQGMCVEVVLSPNLKVRNGVEINR